MTNLETLADVLNLADQGKLFCQWCEEPVTRREVRFSAVVNSAGQVTHFDCSLRSAIGSVGHQMKRCSCYGGTEEDPPGMTRREAARAAAQYFRRSQPADAGPSHQPE